MHAKAAVNSMYVMCAMTASISEIHQLVLSSNVAASVVSSHITRHASNVIKKSALNVSIPKPYMKEYVMTAQGSLEVVHVILRMLTPA